MITNICCADAKELTGFAIQTLRLTGGPLRAYFALQGSLDSRTLIRGLPLLAPGCSLLPLPDASRLCHFARGRKFSKARTSPL